MRVQRRVGVLLLLVAAWLATACGRSPTAAPRPPGSASPTPVPPVASGRDGEGSARPDFAVDAVRSQDGRAAWYDVPEHSLPQRRAWPDEMTAASDVLPMNTYVRVRRLDGGDGKPIVVRITDNGVHHHGVLIDLDRPAASALGMVKAGEARVRVETLALRNAVADKPVDPKESPAAPKASEISGTPAASREAERAAADAKGTP